MALTVEQRYRDCIRTSEALSEEQFQTLKECDRKTKLCQKKISELAALSLKVDDIQAACPPSSKQASWQTTFMYCAGGLALGVLVGNKVGPFFKA